MLVGLRGVGPFEGAESSSRFAVKQELKSCAFTVRLHLQGPTRVGSGNSERPEETRRSMTRQGSNLLPSDEESDALPMSYACRRVEGDRSSGAVWNRTTGACRHVRPTPQGGRVRMPKCVGYASFTEEVGEPSPLQLHDVSKSGRGREGEEVHEEPDPTQAGVTGIEPAPT